MERLGKFQIPAKYALQTGVFLFSFFAFPAHAVRPFVTDDARIVDTGQLESESWLESSHVDGQWVPSPGFNIMVGTTVNDWLEIIIGSGIGNDPNGRFSVANPLIQGKVLLKRAEINGQPGFAFSLVKTFNRGQGSMHDEGSILALIGMTSFRLEDDNVLIHLNYGGRQERENKKRIYFYWGVGVDAQTPFEKLRFISEIFAGDPLGINLPKYAIQTGVRWMRSDYTQVDLTLGAQPSPSGGWEFTPQLGLRLLFDVFTPGGRPGRPDGANGLF